MSDIVERLRAGNLVSKEEAAAEIERLRAEVASLRLTLGGKTFSASIPEPIGCPLPGACSTVAEIERLRAALREIEGAVSLDRAAHDLEPAHNVMRRIARAALAGRDEPTGLEYRGG